MNKSPGDPRAITPIGSHNVVIDLSAAGANKKITKPNNTDAEGFTKVSGKNSARLAGLPPTTTRSLQ